MQYNMLVIVFPILSSFQRNQIRHQVRDEILKEKYY